MWAFTKLRSTRDRARMHWKTWPTHGQDSVWYSHWIRWKLTIQDFVEPKLLVNPNLEKFTDVSVSKGRCWQRPQRKKTTKLFTGFVSDCATLMLETKAWTQTILYAKPSCYWLGHGIGELWGGGGGGKGGLWWDCVFACCLQVIHLL